MSEEYCALAPTHPFHGPYHDTEYGFPARDDRVLFERLVLEINQAGLSWLTVLKKRAAFTAAFADYDLERIARFGERDIKRLLADPGIIRNRLKIEAVIENAGRAIDLAREHGSLAQWLDTHHPLPKEDWVRLFKKTFRFTGGEIVGEFLMSLGYLPGAHVEGCTVYRRILRLDPPWRRAGGNAKASGATKAPATVPPKVKVKKKGKTTS
ncbi:MAG TPA: DNA-3-methyladenine glycosylase I [Stellaceae bacterium]|nr:DNA-3-methyladenine glycosylase I [Stellaceae bacterium]